MKILNRDEFLALPSGVLFCKYEPCIFDIIEIKGDSLNFEHGGNDFFTRPLTGIYTEATGQDGGDPILPEFDRGDEFRWCHNSEGRDGLFEDNQLFAVFDRVDIDKLIGQLLAAELVTPVEL